MKRSPHRLWVALALGAALCSPVWAIDLKDAYQAAIAYDAELLAAKAAQQETEAGVPMARAQLLPQLSYSTQRNKVETDTEYLKSSGPRTDSGKYPSQNSALSLRQPIFRKAQWDALKGAQAQAEAAESAYLGENQRAGLRVAAAYLEVLATREGLRLAQNATAAAEAWLTLAEKGFKAGRASRTDIEDARSRRDMARARQTEAKMLGISAARNFEVVSGIDAAQIPDVDPGRLDPELMRVRNQQEWLQRIEDANPDVQALRKQLEAAQAAVAQARSGHLPTLDFVAARQYQESDTNTTIGVAYHTNYYGVQLNVPLFSGGYVVAQTSQALAHEERVRQTLESNRRKTQAEGTRLFLAVEQGIEQVDALIQAVASAEQAVVGEKKGVQAGTRTFVDALDAERRLYEVKRDHAVAVYTLANNRLKFLALSGVVDLETVETVSVWLSSARL